MQERQEWDEISINIESINLQDKSLRQLPERILELKSLVSLDISNNQLTSLPNLTSLTCLIKFDVSHNRISSFPLVTCRLKFLNISNNKIPYLPINFNNLTNLEELYIQRNDFNLFPTNIKFLLKLKKISLEWFNYTNPIMSMC